MYIKQWKHMGTLTVGAISIFFVVACTTHTQNFENNMNYNVNRNKPSIQKLITIYKKRGNYLGMTRVKTNGKVLERYHVKMKGRPRIEPCYYYYEVESATKKLVGWGYDDKGNKRGCVS